MIIQSLSGGGMGSTPGSGPLVRAKHTLKIFRLGTPTLCHGLSLGSVVPVCRI